MSDFGAYGSADRYGQDDTVYKTQVNASATPDTKGAWTQVCASCPFDASAIVVTIQCSNGSVRTLFDIGVGAAASESVLVPNVFFRQYTAYQLIQNFVVPVAIPSGTRVAIRLQSSTGSADFYFKTHFVAASLFGPQTLQHAVSYGADTANSLGTEVGGAAINTKSGYFQLVASTTYDISAMLICLGLSTLPASGADFSFDLAVGAAASEQIVLPDVFFGANVFDTATHWTLVPAFVSLPVKVPAGSRLSARAQCTAASQSFYMTVVGFS